MSVPDFIIYLKTNNSDIIDVHAVVAQHVKSQTKQTI